MWTIPNANYSGSLTGSLFANAGQTFGVSWFYDSVQTLIKDAKIALHMQFMQEMAWLLENMYMLTGYKLEIGSIVHQKPLDNRRLVYSR
jgi:hypothetical protein